MKKIISICLASAIFLIAVHQIQYNSSATTTGAPPYGEPEEEAPMSLDPYAWIKNWKRPEGKAKVALQVGHMDSANLPDELAKLRQNTGSSGGGKWEWEVNLAIAEELAQYLKTRDVEVEILPATIPPRYWADVFLAIHADGNEDNRKSGYKFASPWRDFTSKSSSLVTLLEEKYEEHTNLEKDPNVTRNMRGYYAFSWWRYEHAIHPMTTAAIAETGFLTSPSDRMLIVNKPNIPATAMGEAIIEFLDKEGLLNKQI